jgi:hypothetical protein
MTVQRIPSKFPSKQRAGSVSDVPHQNNEPEASATCRHPSDVRPSERPIAVLARDRPKRQSATSDASADLATPGNRRIDSAMDPAVCTTKK